jgi:3-oxoacyl-(acyl-carrier-protein) synthase
MGSIRKTHRSRLLDVAIQSDTLQEEFINTAPAWINMLLLSSSGPILTPVGGMHWASSISWARFWI